MIQLRPVRGRPSGTPCRKGLPKIYKRKADSRSFLHRYVLFCLLPLRIARRRSHSRLPFVLWVRLVRGVLLLLKVRNFSLVLFWEEENIGKTVWVVSVSQRILP
jgi:hypothetical protein